MKFGHRIIGTVNEYDAKGRGTFKITTSADGTTSKVVVPFTAVGDELSATFVHRDSGVKVARLEAIQTPSRDRVETQCPHAGTCGGCLWQHLKYEAQLDIKRKMIQSAFTEAGHDQTIAPVLPCPSDKPFRSYYRNRMDYAVGWNSEIGLKEYGSWNRYIDVKTCFLLNEDAGTILQQVREWMTANDLQPWDAKFYHGDIRYVVIREGKHTKQRIIIVVVHDATRIQPAAREDLLNRLSPFCTSLLIGEQNLTTDISLAQKFESVKGEPYFEEIANDVHYRIHPNSFFQTNTVMAEQLQRAVGHHVGAHGMRPDRSTESDARTQSEGASLAPLPPLPLQPMRILDLYCGLGFFGIYLAKQFPDVHVSGFEIDAEAIELAKHNAETNGVSDRCTFTSGPAEDLSWKDIDADVIILDPPRSGLHPKVLKTVMEKKPETIIYVSCNFHRLVEELKTFKELYQIEDVQALDLFPHTPHVEVIVKMKRL